MSGEIPTELGNLDALKNLDISKSFLSTYYIQKISYNWIISTFLFQ